MVKRSSKKLNGNTKRKTNPMKLVQRVSRPRLGFNGQVLQGFTYLGQSTSGGDGAGTQAYLIDCSSNGVASGNNGLIQYYKEYVYESLKVEWIPAIGPASALAGSQIYVSYEENPEHMLTYLAGVASTNNANQLLDNTTKIFNAWERVTFNIPLTRRRRMFDVNTTNAGTVDVLDRSTQGLLILGYNTTVVSSAVGRFKATYNIQLRGLSSVAT